MVNNKIKKKKINGFGLIVASRKLAESTNLEDHLEFTSDTRCGVCGAHIIGDISYRNNQPICNRCK